MNEGGNSSLSGSIYGYFSRKFNFDIDFNATYTKGKPTDWEQSRKDFFSFYGAKASVNFSLGSHDEWNIMVKVNELRMKNNILLPTKQSDMGSLLSGFFDGRQIPLGAMYTAVPKGYEI